MHRLFKLVLVLLVGEVSFSKPLIDQHLKSLINGSKKTETVLILLDQSFPENKPARYDRQNVTNYFKYVSSNVFEKFLNEIPEAQKANIQILQKFWINSSVLAQVNFEGLKYLARQKYVTKIYINEISQEMVEDTQNSVNSNYSDYYNSTTGLSALEKSHPEINGAGVNVGVLDTGADGTHPALKEKIAEYWDGATGEVSTIAKDYHRHGTHVSGTIAGRDTEAHVRIGVAREAKLVVAGAVKGGIAKVLAAMQWFAERKGPEVKLVNCSWNIGPSNDVEPFYRALAVWESAGILPVFSAGNSGPGEATISAPHEYPGTLAVAAYGSDGEVADFSSRGPAVYNGQSLQKPELAAPGVSILSSVPGGNYVELDGTSMATPRVSGTIALLLQVLPNLNPSQIKQILVSTTKLPNGVSPDTRWTKEYGFGNLDAEKSISKALELAHENNPLNPLNLLTFVGSSHIWDLMLLDSSMGEVGGQQDQYHNTDPSQWVTYENL